MKKTLLLLLIATYACPATGQPGNPTTDATPAQVISWTPGSQHANIGRQVSILEDKTGALTYMQVSTPAFQKSFTPSQQSVLHFGFTNSIIWLRFTIDNPTADSLLLELNHAFIPEADLYIQNMDSAKSIPPPGAVIPPGRGSTTGDTTTGGSNTGDTNTGDTNRQAGDPTRQAGPPAAGAGGWTVYHSGFHVPLDHKLVINASQVFPILSGRHDYYLRMQPYAHAIPVSLWEKSSFFLKASRQKLIYGIYTGLLLFAIAINIFLFFLFRRWYYLYYSILVFFYILSSALVMEGFAVYFFPDIDLMFWYRLIPVLDMPALIIYCLSFLEVKRYDRPLYTFSLTACGLLLLYAALLPSLPLMPVYIANQVLAVAIFVLAITIGIRTGRRGNRLGYYFVTAYFIWFVLINLELVYIHTGVLPHIGEISYVSLAIFIEAFLLAWLLVQRFRWEQQEDHRRESEMQDRINRMHREFQHEILSSKLEIQEQTFQEISQEIHDNIGQILSLARLHIATMDDAGNTVLANKIRDSKTLVSKAIHDLRHLSHRLNTDYITEVGFDVAVKREIDAIARSEAYETKFSVEGKPYRFDQQKELILFRIVQELLNNILRHAHAKTISVSLSYDPAALLVMIQDDGQGFDRGALDSRGANGNSTLDSLDTPGTNGNGQGSKGDPGNGNGHGDPGEGHGLGIKSMYHRARLIGAGFQLTSTVGAGTTAAIHLPYPSTAENIPPTTTKGLTL
ncbi:sensor histidine kinase [Puia dinghuensis]|uniref:histidine kinase n=1 Tax=Puia dinghuensis TaxID=1792502 RepID=A0A8J2UIQ1_9BACT|nr:7TM-DISM domain-containing protein [Puia dinghuensis]GGB23441.1 hypothetical protein GCM10011511_54130 [Puia dinghuensis]